MTQSYKILNIYKYVLNYHNVVFRFTECTQHRSVAVILTPRNVHNNPGFSTSSHLDVSQLSSLHTKSNYAHFLKLFPLHLNESQSQGRSDVTAKGRHSKHIGVFFSFRKKMTAIDVVLLS